MSFRLQETLERDTHLLHVGEFAHLLLHKNAIIPWFIWVPHTKETELCALKPEFYNQTLGNCRRLSLWLQKEFNCDKVNFGAIGNLVPQMHLHMVGRSKGDTCWPKPIWGNLEETQEYSEEEVEKLRAKTTQFS